MDFFPSLGPAELISQLIVGLSRSMILFIVCAGLSFVLGVLRVPNIAHGSLYMIGAFATFSDLEMVPRIRRFLAGFNPGPLGGRSDQPDRQKEPYSAISTSEST